MLRTVKGRKHLFSCSSHSSYNITISLSFPFYEQSMIFTQSGKGLILGVQDLTLIKIQEPTNDGFEVLFKVTRTCFLEKVCK